MDRLHVKLALLLAICGVVTVTETRQHSTLTWNRNFQWWDSASQKAKVYYNGTTSCPCANPDNCKFITTRAKKEIFGFVVDSKDFMKYDWTKLTTVVAFLQSKKDHNLMCHAHSKGVRITYGVSYPKSKLTDPAARKAWIAEQVAFAKSHFMDGINFDYETGMAAADKAGRLGLNALCKDLVTAFKSAFPDPQVTFDVPYKPNSSRHYDYKYIGSVMDFLVIMGYDETGYCVTGGCADYHKTVTGAEGFLALGIPASKLVLGLPWYGYDYPCGTLDKEQKCTVVPRCGGRQAFYSEIMGTLLKYTTSGLLWDSKSITPYFSYKDPKTGGMRQSWCDNGRSLSIKYKWAFTKDLLGVAIWRIDVIDYSDTTEGKRQQQDMWGSLPTL